MVYYLSGEFLSMKSKVIYWLSFLFFLSYQAVFAAERVVQMTVPGCTS
jgi:hypothetical protein